VGRQVTAAEAETARWCCSIEANGSHGKAGDDGIRFFAGVGKAAKSQCVVRDRSVMNTQSNCGRRSTRSKRGTFLKGA